MSEVPVSAYWELEEPKGPKGSPVLVPQVDTRGATRLWNDEGAGHLPNREDTGEKFVYRGSSLTRQRLLLCP